MMSEETSLAIIH